MGQYFTYLCLDKTGKVVARCCPLHAFGGLKWGEFIGTPAGERLLKLLQTEFCQEGCRWGVVGDYGFASEEVDDLVRTGSEAYEDASRARDVALDDSLRKRALEIGLTTEERLHQMDKLRTCIRWTNVKDPERLPRSSSSRTTLIDILSEASLRNEILSKIEDYQRQLGVRAFLCVQDTVQRRRTQKGFLPDRFRRDCSSLSELVKRNQDAIGRPSSYFMPEGWKREDCPDGAHRWEMETARSLFLWHGLGAVLGLLDCPAEGLPHLEMKGICLHEKAGSAIGSFPFEDVRLSYGRVWDTMQVWRGLFSQQSPHFKPIRRLALRQMHLSNIDAAELARLGPVRMTSLTHLDLTKNRVRDHGCKSLCGWLKQPSCALQFLSLADNSISSSGGTCFAAVLECNTPLREVDLSKNEMGIGALELMQVLAGSANTTLSKLILSESGVSKQWGGSRKRVSSFNS